MVKSNKVKGLILLLLDIIFINLAYVCSFYIRFSSDVPDNYVIAYLRFLPLSVLLYIIPFYFMKMYSSLWTIAGLDEFLWGIGGGILGIVLNIIIMFVVPLRIPNLVTITSGVLVILFTMTVRLSMRIYKRVKLYKNILNGETKKRVLIIGAGAFGQIAISELRKKSNGAYKIVGLVDDNNNKKGTYLSGVRVLGNTNEVEEIVENKNVDLIVLAISSLSAENKKEIIKKCQNTTAQIKIMPGINELVDSSEIDIKKMRNVDLKDLLGREEIELDKSGISYYLTNKRVLVTGGGGSIGSELCRQIAKFAPKELIILDIYENTAYDLQMELQRNMPELNQKVVIASIRDKKRLADVFEKYKPNVVFHAAAHKHVPLMEFNPAEAIKNNVQGTLNVAQCADRFGVEKFVLISTDKAVNPTNVMGATKRLCEMIVQSINARSKTEYVAVRFGNVLGSNGSVIPLFKKQIEAGGPVTLTHKDITRYFMLIPEAAQLVLQAGAYAKGGEIFVLDMGKPVKIYDLAVDLIKLSGFEPFKDIDIKVVGLRPGEKLYEELLMAENELSNTKHEKIFIEKPADIDYDALMQNISDIVDISKANKANEIRVRLKKIVPSYTPLDEVAVTKNK
ncbi:polysaccharide biosynthesis protein [Clostridium chauvoei]|uniref:polysaccharide biosynthesis protein n=1 Tax=Clostridium chauvoei TaxID=46867 RepID=UPI00207AE212|nr:nucleoside-diphosphate sugar epimerase/dehydratase [Clostridium chauvoei]